MKKKDSIDGFDKLRILIVHNYYQIPGGEDTVVINEKHMLEKNGHEVILYSRSNTELKGMGKLSKLLLPFITVFNLKTFFDIRKIIEESKIDIVHVHNTLNLISPSVYYAAKSLKVPIVQTVHNFRLLCPNATFYRDGHICEDCVNKGLLCAVKHNCYRGSKLQTLACVIITKLHRLTGIYSKLNYICLTEFNKKKLLCLKQIKKANIYVKPNFVEDMDRFVPAEKRENQYIFAGRLDKLKGVDLLLKAWAKIGENAPQLIVCGTGPEEQWCKDFVEENNVKVDFKGFVSNRGVRELIAKSKALILPTRWYEGFPMSIVESYSVGTPVVCSDIGNAGSIVEQGITGYKFEPESEEELVKAVKKLKNNSDIYNSTFNVYKMKYTEKSNYESLLNIYKSIR
mgnify:CR=1 FL=1